MTLTTDELVQKFINMLKESTYDDEGVKHYFEKYNPRLIIDDFDRKVWSIALNDDTRDVRYIEVDGAFGSIEEVRPVTVVDVHTEYRR
jgi:hypothetical protein